MEQRDLYDINRKLTGKTIFKGEPTPEGSYINVVLVFIQNSEGKFLIQKRSERKNGKFATTGGHPKSGENSVQGILSETKEEIGLDLNPNDLKLYYSGRSDAQRVFWDDYYISMDVDDIKKLPLQKEEVDSLCWLSTDEIQSLMKDDKFFKNHYEEFEILLDWLRKGKTK
ncbi:MAG: NUDIX domain-containing protein [Clostridia bacterium]|nr:NUDIX domain-containing protein [Clostridia bacterium]